MVEWPDGPRLFEYLRGLPARLRVADLTGSLGSLGLSQDLWGSTTLRGTPMHHGSELPVPDGIALSSARSSSFA